MNSNWTDLLSQQMEHHEVEAPKGLWDDIERGLEAQQPKRRAKLVWAWRVGAAAAVAAGVVVGVQMWEKPEKGGAVQVAKTERQKPAEALPAQGGNAQNRQDVALSPQRVAPHHSATALLSTSVTPAASPVGLVHEEAPAAKAEEALPVTTASDNPAINENAANIPLAILPQNDAPLLAESTADDMEEVYVVTVPREKEGRVAMPQIKRQKRPVSLQLMAMATGEFSNSYDAESYDEVFLSVMAPSDSVKMESQRRAMPAGPARIYRLKDTSPVYGAHDFPVKVGLTLRVPLGRRFALDAGLSYARMNSELSSYIHEGKLKLNGTQRVDYLGVPVALTADLWQNRRWSVYASAGGEVAKSVKTTWCTATGQSFDVNVRPWQWSASAAVGVQLNITQHVGLYVQPSADYYFDNHSAVQTYYTEHPFTPALRMGVRVKL